MWKIKLPNNSIEFFKKNQNNNPTFNTIGSYVESRK